MHSHRGIVIPESSGASLSIALRLASTIVLAEFPLLDVFPTLENVVPGVAGVAFFSTILELDSHSLVDRSLLAGLKDKKVERLKEEEGLTEPVYILLGLRRRRFASSLTKEELCLTTIRTFPLRIGYSFTEIIHSPVLVLLLPKLASIDSRRLPRKNGIGLISHGLTTLMTVWGGDTGQ